MENFQVNPLKVYIKDIYRAKQSNHNKYIYELFGMTFKNVMIHGIVTAIYNKTEVSANIELSDGTGSVQIYCDTTKVNLNVSNKVIKDLSNEFAKVLASGHVNIPIIRVLHKAILSKSNKPINFEEGSYLCVIGDIFVDELKNVRMISAFEFNHSSTERELVWLEELKYLYLKYYLCNS